MCWAAKWYGKEEVFFDSIQASSARRMLKRIHKLVHEADVVVHYNGTKFDIPTLNKEFITYEMMPPAPYKQVDLIKTARGKFRFPSNKLDYISQALGLGSKVKHSGHELWTRCMAKDPEAWKEMETYNRRDVQLLEKLYIRLLPWINAHPNHGTYENLGRPACPNCGGYDLQRRGYARSIANKYARFQCKGCGTWCREPFSEFNKEDRGNILRKDNG